MSNPFAYIMAPKEESELKTIQRACQVSCDVFTKYLKDQIMEVIDADKVRGFSIQFETEPFFFYMMHPPVRFPILVSLHFCCLGLKGKVAYIFFIPFPSLTACESSDIILVVSSSSEQGLCGMYFSLCFSGKKNKTF